MLRLFSYLLSVFCAILYSVVFSLSLFWIYLLLFFQSFLRFFAFCVLPLFSIFPFYFYFFVRKCALFPCLLPDSIMESNDIVHAQDAPLTNELAKSAVKEQPVGTDSTAT